MAGRVEGKVAFITGAARSQGRSHAVRLAQEGADIIAVDFLDEVPGAPYPAASQQEFDETARQVEALDRRIVVTKADVRELAALKNAVDDGVAQLGRLDVVSANAGIGATQMAQTQELDEDKWQNMLDTNLTGVWHAAKAAIPHIKAGGEGGSIILTSSEAGLRTYQNIGHYVSAKHGVVGLMRTMALELAPESIRVNSIHPTQVNTTMIQNQETYDLFTGREGATKDEFAQASGAMIPMPIPWVESVDISNAVLFLASNESRYITGVPLPVDGGQLIM